MQNDKETQYVYEKNRIMEAAVLSVIGDRDSQQDSFGISVKSDGGMIVLCDGMGGHQGGRLASVLAKDTFLNDFERLYPNGYSWLEMLSSAKKCDEKITELTSQSGEKLNAGTTCVAVTIYKNTLFWCSVGDSRAYLLRNGEFVRLTNDQNYEMILKDRLRKRIIDEEQYRLESEHKDALISYLGIGNLSLIDYNDTPLNIKSGDKIVVMTDGLYKLLDDSEICHIIENFTNCSEALQILEMRAEKSARKKQVSRDNMTVAVISVI